MDWSDCEIVEVVPGKGSGAPLLVGTRIPVEAITVNYESSLQEGMSSDEAIAELSENYPGAGIERIKNLLAYYQSRQPQHQP
jgi:uncharacterized protein (DUF433 family)